MRGRSSSAKSRLRSAGYKCNLCGRRLIDAATLERHQRTIHHVYSRDNKLNFKPRQPGKNKVNRQGKEKIIDDLAKEQGATEPKPKLRKSRNSHGNVREKGKEDSGDDKQKISDKDVEVVKNGESVSVEKDKSKNQVKDLSKRVEFECPVCKRTFCVYFTAYKHIQRVHAVDADGNKVASTSPELVQPIRVEHCQRCDLKMRSNEQHMCPNIVEEPITVVADYVCSGCNQIFVSLKSFDMHVAALHSDAVDSMFFPTKIEFMTWRLEMERQTNAKYSLYGEYESKKVYRCNYARNDMVKENYTAYFCPSSMVVQEFSKGIQVHFYNKHYDHTATVYTLSGKYKRYSITSFLKSPNDDGSVESAASSVKLDDKELHSQFKRLMESIVLHAADVDVSVLKTLIEKALEMSSIVTDAAVIENVPDLKPAKTMSDKEITEALEMKTVLDKRRRSMDSCETPKPAKRSRNKSLYNQSDIKMSPKILNTFSLASGCDNFKSDNGDSFDFNCISNIDDKISFIHDKNASESDITGSKSSKMGARVTSFNESPSFNDSYKDFIDKNFIGKGNNTKEMKLTRNTVKTKLGFKQTSPKKVEIKDDDFYDTPANKRVGMKAISPINSLVDEEPEIKTETPKFNILSVETSKVNTKVSSIKMETVKGANSRMNAQKVDASKINTPKTKSRAVPQLNSAQVNVTKFNRRNASSIESHRGNVSKVKSRSVSTPLVDPLELNITKVKCRNVSGSLTDPVQRNVSKLNRNMSSPLLDPLKLSTPKVDKANSGTSKVETSKHTFQVNPLKLNPSKANTHKVYTGPGTPKSSVTVKSTPKVNFEGKVSPKVTFEDDITFDSSDCFKDKQCTSAYNKPRIVSARKKITEFKYEVREQENDCNILVLKF